MCGVNEVAEKVEDRPSQVLCGLGVSSENRDCPAPGSREMTLYPVNLEKWGQEGRGRERVWELFLVRRFCCSAVCTPAGSAEPRFPHQAQHAVSECEVPGCLPFSAQALPPLSRVPRRQFLRFHTTWRRSMRSPMEMVEPGAGVSLGLLAWRGLSLPWPLSSKSTSGA